MRIVYLRYPLAHERPPLEAAYVLPERPAAPCAGMHPLFSAGARSTLPLKILRRVEGGTLCGRLRDAEHQRAHDPTCGARRRYLVYLEALMGVASAQPPDSDAAADLVARQWNEIMAEPDARLRKLLAIQYATCVAQLTGPEHILRLEEVVSLTDPAWIAQAAFLTQMLWSLGEHQLADELLRELPRHHRDPGLQAALLGWLLSRAQEREDADEVAALYRELSGPRFRQTHGLRNARKLNPDRALRIGAALPAFSAVRLSTKEERIAQADLAGHVWLIHVWSSWCKPCIDELDALPKLYARLRADELDVEFLSISTDEERATCERTLAGREIPWVRAWTAQPEELMKGWGFAGVPLTVVVDARGTVVGVWDKATSMASIEKVIRTALAERGT